MEGVGFVSIEGVAAGEDLAIAVGELLVCGVGLCGWCVGIDERGGLGGEECGGDEPPPVGPELEGPVWGGVVLDDSSGGFAFGGGGGDVGESCGPAGDGEGDGGGEAGGCCGDMSMERRGDGGGDGGDGVLEDLRCSCGIEGIDWASDVLFDGGEHEGELGVDECVFEEDDPAEVGFDLVEGCAGGGGGVEGFGELGGVVFKDGDGGGAGGLFVEDWG